MQDSSITLYDMALLSNDAYNNQSSTLRAASGNAVWEREDFPGAIDKVKSNGFFAVLYGYHPENQHLPTRLVIAYRGTSSVADALIDMELAAGQAIEQGHDTINFLAEVLNYAKHQNILPKDIYITGHSLGGGLAQWVSMLTVDNHELFNGELNTPTAMRTVAFNPPGMQEINPNGRAPAYTKALNSSVIVASVNLAFWLNPGAFVSLATKAGVDKICEIIDHQLGLKSRQNALKMGQRALIFAWDLMRPDEQGKEDQTEIANCYPHIYNVSARYDMVHCCGIPGGNLISLDIDKMASLPAAHDSKNRLRHEFLDHYFTARLHYLKRGVHSAKMKIMYQHLSKAANDFIYHAEEQQGIPTVKDWENYFSGRKIVPGASLVEINSPEVFKAFYGRELLVYTVTTEHSMVNMLAAIQKSTDLAQVTIGYDTVRTLINFAKKPNVYIHTTARHQTLGRATDKNVVTYEQGYARKPGGHAVPVYPYNQENYQSF
ncbi:Mbeg1-like protein [Piscirickettsia litoralis]|uniref:Fungal lipase-like domain-containing protein n=1 Tax=Piscirickettsia litoralis TaxID=1891921 RepID=A0ABX3A2U6_9GAMM|nr:Mbeg1-like protein [Piscirickettsia litoralis]ODN43197.1 hypothetical protein BGC07_10050 [Piscirickettsia litoralis]